MKPSKVFSSIQIFVVAIFVQLLISSCSPDTENVSIDLIAFDKFEAGEGNQYPAFIQEILIPFEGICKPKHPVGFSPIVIKRKDLGVDFEIKYLTNKAGDNSKVKFINRQLVNYFKGNQMDSTFYEPAQDLSGFDTYQKSKAGQKGYFIFSKNEDLVVEGYEIYSSADILRNAIAEFICQDDKGGKVTVIIAPNKIPNKKPAPTQNTVLASYTPEMKAVLEEAEHLNEDAASWLALFESIGEHIHTESEHKYGHPEGYTLLITAARRAIADGEHMKMYEKMRVEIDKRSEISKLAKGHHHWEEVAKGLLTKDTEMLDHVIEEVYSNWLDILRKKGSLDKHHDEEHDH